MGQPPTRYSDLDSFMPAFDGIPALSKEQSEGARDHAYDHEQEHEQLHAHCAPILPNVRAPMSQIPPRIPGEALHPNGVSVPVLRLFATRPQTTVVISVSS